MDALIAVEGIEFMMLSMKKLNSTDQSGDLKIGSTIKQLVVKKRILQELWCCMCITFSLVSRPPTPRVT